MSINRQGISLPEGIVALGLISISIVFVSNLAMSYINILTSVRERFLALNLAQEGIELSIALRNKKIENSSSPSPDWSGITTSGTYCLFFNESNRSIMVTPSNSPCPVPNYPNYRRLVRYEDFLNPNNINLTRSIAIKVISEVYFGRNDKINLNVILTKWHPNL